MIYELDATNQSLGRLATKIATILRGKNTPAYTPNAIPDVKVVILNLDKAKFTGTKFTGKLYHRYSGYPGGLYTRTLEQEWTKSPREVLRKVVYRMLPVNRSRDKVIQNIIYK